MLLGKKRRWNKDRCLFAILHRLKHCPDRNFGLSESHIATHKAIHRRLAFHVGFDFVNCRLLIRRRFKRERLFKFALPWRIGTECVTRGVNPLLIKHHEFLRDSRYGFTNTSFVLLPLAAPESTQARRVTAGKGPHRIDLIAWNIKAIVSSIFKKQVVALNATDRSFHHSAVATNAMLVVHDEIARCEVVEMALGSRLAWTSPTMRTATPGDVRFGKECKPKIRKPHAAFERGNDNVPTGS
ncbi:unannotated protein [freshwater metagenome]|uniref:Unannotated protein n=1 Tax=freshwater metagenome TaxID=449393 RepID=A0A6J6R8M6_9ZZZZ